MTCFWTNDTFYFVNGRKISVLCDLETFWTSHNLFGYQFVYKKRKSIAYCQGPSFFYYSYPGLVTNPGLDTNWVFSFNLPLSQFPYWLNFKIVVPWNCSDIETKAEFSEVFV